jgi:hypothetical protein
VFSFVLQKQQRIINTTGNDDINNVDGDEGAVLRTRADISAPVNTSYISGRHIKHASSKTDNNVHVGYLCTVSPPVNDTKNENTTFIKAAVTDQENSNPHTRAINNIPEYCLLGLISIESQR